jgi:hypothetical protein
MSTAPMSTAALSASAATSTGDVPARVADVTAAAQRLTEAVARENTALRGRSRVGLTALAEEKAAATNLYQGCLAALDAATEGYRTLTVDQREALRHCGGLLAREADENARLLKVAVEISRRFMETVADAVRALQPGAPGYSRAGVLGGGARASARAPALSLDRSL